MDLVEKQSVIVVVGQRVYCSLAYAGMGTVYEIRGEQSPQTVRTFAGGVGVTGGNADFAVVFDNGSRSLVPECIVRGIQWEIYAETVDAAGVAAALAFADEVKARKEEAARQADEAHAAEKAALLAAHPELASPNETAAADKSAAANIRKQLKAAFPAVKFSVRMERGGSIRVSWTDGPTAAQVDAITDRYLEGHFDGMDDSYKYVRSAWVEVFGGARYISTQRDTSLALIERAIGSVFEQYAGNLVGIERPTPDEYRFGHVYLVQVPGLDESLATLIRRAAFVMEG